MRISDKEHFQKRFPWSVLLYSARQRCENPNNPGYKDYGGRGIQCFLTLDDVRCLWERDGAKKLNHPSLDRKDVNGDYTLENCRVIELAENAKRRRNTRTGCLVCGPLAKHHSAGLCNPCWCRAYRRKAMRAERARRKS